MTLVIPRHTFYRYYCVETKDVKCMSKQILVPTDFSHHALIAARYASSMAKQLGWSLHLIHTYTPFSSSFANEKFNQELLDHETDKAYANMRAFHDELAAEFPDLEITTSCLTGLLGDVLPEISGQAKNELIVMGTKGASGLKHVILGSNTFEIIRKSPIPVLAVPETQAAFRWETIGLLTNFKQSEINALQSAVAIVGRPKGLTLLHMFEKDSHRNEVDLTSWKDHIQDRLKISKISYKAENLVNRMDVWEDFPDYVFNMVESENIDVLVVTQERKGFLTKLFSRNLVKAIAHQLKVPVFFHNIGP